MTRHYAQFLVPLAVGGTEGLGDDPVDFGMKIIPISRRYPFNLADKTGLEASSDVTNQPEESTITDPNGFIVELWAHSLTIDALIADPQYVLIPGTRVDTGEVPDSNQPTVPELPPTYVPDQAEFDAFRLEIEAVFNPILDSRVWTSNQINDALSTTVNGRTWEQIRSDLNVYCKTAPKGGEVMLIEPSDIGDGNVGWQPGSGGIEPNTVFQVPVGRVASNSSFGGIFALDLDPTLDIQKAFILGVEVGGQVGLKVADAYWDDIKKQWLWFNTGFHFTPGQIYTMVVYR